MPTKVTINSSPATLVPVDNTVGNNGNAVTGAAVYKYVPQTGVPIESFGAVGNNVTDDFPAFQAAAASNNKVIVLAPKTYYVNNGIGDSTTRLANMIMFADKYFVGQEGTVIRFNYNGLPLFTIFNAAFGGFKNIKFVFSGTTQTSGDVTLPQFRTKLGVTTLSGSGLAEIGVVYAFNSNNVVYHNIIGEALTPGTSTNCVGIWFHAKANEDTVNYNYGLNIKNCFFYDSVMGILLSSQRNFEIDGIKSKRRIGTSYYPPGHVIYLTGGNGITVNQYGSISNVFDYGENITTGGVASQNIATLSCKYVQYCTFDNITSYHPQGLVQSFDNYNDNVMNNCSWYKVESEVPGNYLNFVGPTAQPCRRNTFSNFTIIAPAFFVNIGITSNLQNLFEDNVFKGFYIKMKSNYNAGQGALLGAFDIYGNNNTVDATIELTEAVPSSNYNTAANLRGTSTNNNINITVVGQYVHQRFLRPLATAATSNKFKWSLPKLINGDLFGVPTTSGNTQVFSSVENRFAESGPNTSGTGLTKTYQLDGEGVYEITATISNTAKTSMTTATTKVIYSPTASQFSVAAHTPSTWGSVFSNLVLSVDATGLLTITFDKSSTGNSGINVSIKYLSGIGSNF